MATAVSISASATPSLALCTKPRLSLNPPPSLNQSCFVNAAAGAKPYSISLPLHPLRVRVAERRRAMWRGRGGCRAVCYSGPLTTQSIQWICTVSTAVLALVHGTGIRKAFLVPIFALQAPLSIVSWIKGDYGLWTAFLALLVRLFFFIPGELELPLAAFLIVGVAPYEVMRFRGTQEGAVLSLVIAGYLAFQHFTRIGSLRKAFDQGSIVATLAVISITVMSCLLLF
uniref:Uncharacterized protein n=1 Tax=Kalanchoe fedtschenkoi TaxID=63787 RepID=A0A7N0T3U7_KALFE